MVFISKETSIHILFQGDILIYMNKIPPFLQLLTFFPIFLLPLGMPIESEIMDRFRNSRCLNNHIDLLQMIGPWASGANASLVAKIGTKKIILLLLIKSSPVDGFLCLRCLKDQHDRISCKKRHKLLGGQNWN